MPEFTVKEVRLPELQLPEIKRDEIVRALSGIRLPDVDLAKGDQRRRLPGRALGALPWRKRGLSTNDLGTLIAAAVATARLVRPASPRFGGRRSRQNLVAIVRPAPRRSGRRFAFLAGIVGAGIGRGLPSAPAARLRRDRAAPSVPDARD